MADLTGLGSVADLVKDLADKFLPDKQQAERDAFALAVQQAISQAQTNTAEASNPNVFVAGWRPAVGWMCAAIFGVNYILGPISQYICALTGHVVPWPSMDWTAVTPILLGMLGLAGMRSYDKTQGTGNGS